MRLTPTQRTLLERGRENAHIGGFYTADRSEYNSCARLRARRLLMFWMGRKSRFWSSQFFTITDAGRLALSAGDGK